MLKGKTEVFSQRAAQTTSISGSTVLNSFAQVLMSDHISSWPLLPSFFCLSSSFHTDYYKSGISIPYGTKYLKDDKRGELKVKMRAEKREDMAPLL